MEDILHPEFLVGAQAARKKPPLQGERVDRGGKIFGKTAVERRGPETFPGDFFQKDIILGAAALKVSLRLLDAQRGESGVPALEGGRALKERRGGESGQILNRRYRFIADLSSGKQPFKKTAYPDSVDDLPDSDTSSGESRIVFLSANCCLN